MQQPSIGRLVHFYNLGDDAGEFPCAALITGLREDIGVSLKVFYPSGLFDMHAVPFSETPRPGHWSWPPRL